MTGSHAKLHLEDLTSAELRALLPRRPLVLLPLGSQEDQGAHAPMGDFCLAALIGAQIAQRATAAGTLTLLAPTLPFGAADHFGAIPGGLALAPATFRAVLSDLLDNLRHNGLSRVIILNGHGGNAPLIHEVTLAIRRAGGPIIPSVYLWKIARRLMERQSAIPSARFGHAGEPLASITLALRPAAARPDLATPPAAPAQVFGCPVTGFGAIGYDSIEIDAPLEYPEIAPNSAAADATAADAARGTAIVAELVAMIARFCAHAATQA
ncbi:creatininase family protein [Acidiphilium sp.]|uniref:creatininase family protein n=1 Tax=Acidiphilium sp. TaxID=527 RepID=UPI003CFF7C45